MESRKLNYWLQIIGMLGVIASLIFVGLELRQSQEIAIAAQYQARLDSNLNQINSQMESEAVMNLTGKGVRRYIESSDIIPEAQKAWLDKLTDEELAIQIYMSYASLKSYDNIYFQYKAGFLDEDSWDALRSEFKRDLGNPLGGFGIREYYNFDRTIWRTPFRKLIEELIAEIDTKTE